MHLIKPLDALLLRYLSVYRMVDKRRLMKFMTFCLEWNTKADELEGWKGEMADIASTTAPHIW